MLVLQFGSFGTFTYLFKQMKTIAMVTMIETMATPAEIKYHFSLSETKKKIHFIIVPFKCLPVYNTF